MVLTYKTQRNSIISLNYFFIVGNRININKIYFTLEILFSKTVFETIESKLIFEEKFILHRKVKPKIDKFLKHLKLDRNFNRVYFRFDLNRDCFEKKDARK